MKELFRERDYTKVGYFESVLEAEGIPCIVRNKHLTMSGITEIPIPEFFPALCVIDEEDYEPAMEIIRRHLRENSIGVEREVACAVCGETSPGNFDVCWACDADLTDTRAE